MVNKQSSVFYGDVYITTSLDPTVYGTGNLTIDGDLDVLGNLNISVDHSGLGNLTSDDHPQYLLLSGRTGGQSLIGGIASGNDLTIMSTSDTTKGSVIFPETTNSISGSSGSVLIYGSIGIQNTTDAVDSTNGGTISTYGGIAIGKKAFIGGLLTAENGLTVLSTSNLQDTDISGILNITNTTDSTNLSTGSGKFNGGVAISKNLYVGTGLNLNTLTASQIVATDASKNLVSVSTTGTGNVVLANSPTLVTPNIGAATATTINTGAITGTSATFSSTLGVTGLATLNGGLTSTSGQTVNIGTSGTTSPLNVYGLLTGSNGLTINSGTTSLQALLVTSLSNSGQINMNNNKIVNLGTPTLSSDAATKNYVDTVSQGLNTKSSVIAATTTPGTLSTSFQNGSVIDGVTLATNDRILIKDQASGIENGIYTVNTTGAPTRTSDFSAGSSQGGSYVFVVMGTVNDNMGFVVTNDKGVDIVGTDSIVFTQFSGAGQVIAGTGLSKTGNTLSVNNSLPNVTSLGTLTSLSTGPLTGTSATFSSTLIVTAGATFNNNLTVSGIVTMNNLTASRIIGTNGAKNIISYSVTGAGSVAVLALSPTLVTPNIGAATATTLSTGAITGTSATFSTTLDVTGLTTLTGGLTSTAATTTLGTTTIGVITGTSANFSGTITLNNLTASSVVATDASKNLVSLATTGTGNIVLANSPTLVTPNIGAATATTLSTGAITGTSAAFSSTLGVTGLTTLTGGLTSTAATTTLGTTTIGAITGTSATFSGVVTLNNLTASSVVATDASKNLVSLATTGTGNIVLANSPTLVTPNIGAATATTLSTGAITGTSAAFSGTLGVTGLTTLTGGLTSTTGTTTLGTTTIGAITGTTGAFSGTITLNNLTASSVVATDSSKNLISVATTGTGDVVLATSPTLITPNIGAATATTLTTGDITGTAATFSTTLDVTGVLTASNNIVCSGNISLGEASSTGERSLRLKNTSTSVNAFSMIRFINDVSGNLVMFLNSSTRTNDGGTNGATIRNEATTGTGGINIYGGTGNLGIKISTPGIVTLNNTTDATDASTAGAVFLGGAGFAKKVFVGTDLNVGNLTPSQFVTTDASKNLTSFNFEYAYVSDTKASGTNGGNSTANTWVTRTLNTITSSANISLASNTVTFSKNGVYMIDVVCNCVDLRFNQLRLFNVTNSTVLVYGHSRNHTSTAITVTTHLRYILTVTATIGVRIEHRSSNTITNGFGVACGFGNVETYTTCTINQIG